MIAVAGRLAARCVVLAPGRYLSPGEIVWDAAGRVLAVRRARGAVADLCILPGLVDAHTHLQIEPLAAPDSPDAFVPWARAVMAARAAQSPAALRAAARRAAQARLAEGVTAVGEIDSTGNSPGALAGLGLTGRCYQELTGYDLGAAAAVARVRERRRRGDAGLAAGLSPHAPYSVGAPLFAAAAQGHRWLAVHCAETPEEQHFLRHGEGPFAELLRALGKLPASHRAPGVGAVRWLERLGLLRASTQLVHCQELEPGDEELIAAAGGAIVVCPGTIAWFGRTPPPVPRWLARGIRVALGTDSSASNSTPSLRAAMRSAAAMWPELAPAQVFAMATATGAIALGRPGLGRLMPRGRADFLALRATSAAPTAQLEAFLHGDAAPSFVVAGGRLVVDAASGVEPIR